MKPRGTRRRLSAKLIASYVLLGGFITLVSLLGSHFAQGQVATKSLYRIEVLRRTQELSMLTGSAAEEGFSYLISQQVGEKQAALDRLAALDVDVRALRTQFALTPDEEAHLEAVAVSLARMRRAADGMFETYERLGAAPTFDEAYEEALDGLTDDVGSLSTAVRAQFAIDRAAASRKSDWLTTLIGLLSVAVAVVAGIALSRRITQPLMQLRDAAIAFGAGDLDARVDVRSNDEIGELATTFEAMAADTRRHLEQRFEDIFASMRELLVVYRSDGTILSANPAVSRASGFGEGAILGMTVSELFGEAVPTDSAGESSSIVDRETAMKTADGVGVPVRVNVTRLRGRRSDGWVLVAQDLTERHRLEGELRQAQKMEAIGRLAGGVAHDFNNMLSIILSYSDILLSETDPNDEKFALLSEVKLAGERSADLTRQLLAFSQQRPLETKVVAIDGIVESTSRMIRLVVGEDVALTTHLATEGSFARVAPGQIEQVLMNLVVNARDAMPVGGKLTIETAPFELDASSPVTHPDMLPGRYLMLAVSDSGSGMDARTVERIFEPFFTTKEQGRGTGLGLSTVFGIVRQVGGQIYVYSELGKGTTFKLYFPEHRGPDQETADVGPQVSAAPSSETVLLVEDDAQVRKLAHEVLRRRGYHVLSAEHPGEALLVCDGYEGPIDLLLTDVIMPQMSGRQLADRLVVARPDMKVLYVSGYTANVVLDHGVGQTTAFLQKPFTPDSLSRTVRSVLDSHALPAVAP